MGGPEGREMAPSDVHEVALRLAHEQIVRHIGAMPRLFEALAGTGRIHRSATESAAARVAEIARRSLERLSDSGASDGGGHAASDGHSDGFGPILEEWDLLEQTPTQRRRGHDDSTDLLDPDARAGAIDAVEAALATVFQDEAARKLVDSPPMLVGLLTLADIAGVRSLPDIVERARDYACVAYATQTALSYVLGTSRITPVWRPITVTGESLAQAGGHLSALADMLHKMQLAQPFVAESLFRREHHLGSSVFECALAANWPTKVADVSATVSRTQQGLMTGYLYHSAKGRPLGLTFMQSALINRATGYSRHLPLVFGSLPARSRRLESSVVGVAILETMEHAVNPMLLAHCQRSVSVASFRMQLNSAIPVRGSFSALHSMFTCAAARRYEVRELTLPETVEFTVAVAEVARRVFRNRVQLTQSQIRATEKNVQNFPIEVVQMILQGAAEALETTVTRALTTHWRRMIADAQGQGDLMRIEREPRRRRLASQASGSTPLIEEVPTDGDGIRASPPTAQELLRPRPLGPTPSFGDGGSVGSM